MHRRSRCWWAATDELSALAWSYCVVAAVSARSTRAEVDARWRKTVTIGATADISVEFEPFRAELTGYCYRMLGSAFEADDAVQATMVRAWRGYHRFEGRSSLRSWLYRIATNVCIALLKGRARRAVPMDVGPSSPGDKLLGEPSRDVRWLEPLADVGIDPADVAVGRETIRLAF